MFIIVVLSLGILSGCDFFKAKPPQPETRYELVEIVVDQPLANIPIFVQENNKDDVVDDVFNYSLKIVFKEIKGEEENVLIEEVDKTHESYDKLVKTIENKTIVGRLVETFLSSEATERKETVVLSYKNERFNLQGQYSVVVNLNKNVSTTQKSEISNLLFSIDNVPSEEQEDMVLTRFYLNFESTGPSIKEVTFYGINVDGGNVSFPVSGYHSEGVLFNKNNQYKLLKMLSSNVEESVNGFFFTMVNETGYVSTHYPYLDVELKTEILNKTVKVPQPLNAKELVVENPIAEVPMVLFGYDDPTYLIGSEAYKQLNIEKGVNPHYSDAKYVAVGVGEKAEFREDYVIETSAFKNKVTNAKINYEVETESMELDHLFTKYLEYEITFTNRYNEGKLTTNDVDFIATESRILKTGTLLFDGEKVNLQSIINGNSFLKDFSSYFGEEFLFVVNIKEVGYVAKINDADETLKVKINSYNAFDIAKNSTIVKVGTIKEQKQEDYKALEAAFDLFTPNKREVDDYEHYDNYLTHFTKDVSNIGEYNVGAYFQAGVGIYSSHPFNTKGGKSGFEQVYRLDGMFGNTEPVLRVEVSPHLMNSKDIFVQLEITDSLGEKHLVTHKLDDDYIMKSFAKLAYRHAPNQVQQHLSNMLSQEKFMGGHQSIMLSIRHYNPFNWDRESVIDDWIPFLNEDYRFPYITHDYYTDPQQKYNAQSITATTLALNPYEMFNLRYKEIPGNELVRRPFWYHKFNNHSVHLYTTFAQPRNLMGDEKEHWESDMSFYNKISDETILKAELYIPVAQGIKELNLKDGVYASEIQVMKIGYSDGYEETYHGIGVANALENYNLEFNKDNDSLSGEVIRWMERTKIPDIIKVSNGPVIKGVHGLDENFETKELKQGDLMNLFVDLDGYGEDYVVLGYVINDNLFQFSNLGKEDSDRNEGSDYMFLKEEINNSAIYHILYGEYDSLGNKVFENFDRNYSAFFNDEEYTNYFTEPLAMGSGWNAHWTNSHIGKKTLANRYEGIFIEQPKYVRHFEVLNYSPDTPISLKTKSTWEQNPLIAPFIEKMGDGRYIFKDKMNFEVVQHMTNTSSYPVLEKNNTISKILIGYVGDKGQEYNYLETDAKYTPYQYPVLAKMIDVEYSFTANDKDEGNTISIQEDHIPNIIYNGYQENHLLNQERYISSRYDGSLITKTLTDYSYLNSVMQPYKITFNKSIELEDILYIETDKKVIQPALNAVYDASPTELYMGTPQGYYNLSFNNNTLTRLYHQEWVLRALDDGVVFINNPFNHFYVENGELYLYDYVDVDGKYEVNYTIVFKDGNRVPLKREYIVETSKHIYDGITRSHIFMTPFMRFNGYSNGKGFGFVVDLDVDKKILGERKRMSGFMGSYGEFIDTLAFIVRIDKNNAETNPALFERMALKGEWVQKRYYDEETSYWNYRGALNFAINWRYGIPFTESIPYSETQKEVAKANYQGFRELFGLDGVEGNQYEFIINGIYVYDRGILLKETHYDLELLKQSLENIKGTEFFLKVDSNIIILDDETYENYELGN